MANSVFFKNIFYNRSNNKVYVREVVDGEENRFVDDFVRTVYVPDGGGDYRDIYGNRVKRMDVSYEQMKSLQTMFKDKLCESDLSEDVKYIASHYYQYGDMMPRYEDFNVCFLDIEVESPDEFPKPEFANYPINLISFYSSKTGKVTTFGNRPYTGENKEIEYHYYEDEVEMMDSFVKTFRKNKFDVITGWYSNNFDLQYIINRCGKLGVDVTKMSPYGIVSGRLGREVNGRSDFYPTIAGITCLDYKDMYENFTFETRESYTLNFIANYEIGEGKLELEGQVNNEWKTNWNNFVDYNILDVMLVKKIDDKKKFLSLSILMAHECLIPIERVTSAVAVTEGMILRDLKANKMVMPDRRTAFRDFWKECGLYNSGRGKPNGIENDPVNDDDKFKSENGVFKDFYIKGGHVEAYANWYKDVLSFDVESEYPHMIMAYNISPETKVFNPSKERIAGEKLIKSAVNGIYFKNKEGILPRITSKVFNERKRFKKMRDEQTDKVLYAYYDSMQHIRKIQVNSIYGVMGSKFFHFYDVDCARATTRGGRQMIRFLAKGFDNYFQNHFHREFNKLFPERFMENPPQLQNKVVCLIDTDSVVGSTKITTNRGVYKIEELYDIYNIFEKQTGVDNYIIEMDDIYPESRKLTVDSFDTKALWLYEQQGKVQYIKKHLVKKRFYRFGVERHKRGRYSSATDTTSIYPYVDVTEDHSVIVKKPWGDIIACKPTEVQKGDYIRSDGRWFPNFAVQDLGIKEEWVYDLGVENYHTFIGNGIAVHNSNYLTVHEIMEKYFSDKTFDEMALEIETKIMNPLIEKMLTSYWGHQNLNNIINFKREGVILDMIILAKKKYIKNIIRNESKVYDKPQVKYTGVEVVRSDVPRFTRDELDSFYKGLFKLDYKDREKLRKECLQSIWKTKKKFKVLSIEQVSFNSAVKEYTKWAKDTDWYIKNGLEYEKGVPIHVRAAMNYNYLIKKLNLPYQPVSNGTKVKYAYVKSKKPNLIQQEVVAYVGNFPKELYDVFDIDWKKQYDKSYLSPIQKFFDVMNLGDAGENENVSKFFD